MQTNSKFWLMMAVFQVIFGLLVFGATREYYLREPGDLQTSTNVAAQESVAWSGRVSDINPVLLESLTSTETSPLGPAEISQQANQHFASGQYVAAAALYEQLLAFGPTNADTHNNLGLTLHYLGRSDEALQRLKEGTALDPLNQRIWLTTGFVNSQAGNIAVARDALTTAVEMDPDSEVGRSAARMLEGLR